MFFKPDSIQPLSALTLRIAAQPLLHISLNCPITCTPTNVLPTSLQDFMLDDENQHLRLSSLAHRW